ncbi:MAG: 3-keto-disaccharide hydrolase, partial [Actinomycetota bacterium]
TLAAVALLAISAAAAHAAPQPKPPKGFKGLFNGKHLTNWQGLIELPKRDKMSPAERQAAQTTADELMRAHWSIQDGVLVYDGKGQSLQTVKDYGDVEFYVDWRIQDKGDSGIYLRGTPQVQIWEPNSSSAGIVDGKFVGSGGLFNNQKNPSRPIMVADNPVGQWNTFYIKMVGDRVTVKLNDKVVVNDTPLENYWDRSKPLPAVGPIELQHHGNRLEFRNIYVKELPRGGSASAASAGVTMRVIETPLIHAIRQLESKADIRVVLDGPISDLADRRVGYASVHDVSAEEALAAIAEAAGARGYRDEAGVYHVSRR